MNRIEAQEKELHELRAEVSELEARLNHRDQMDLVDHFRLTNLPPNLSPTKEEQTEIVIKFLSIAGMICEPKDIAYCQIYKLKNDKGSVIVGKFASSSIRAAAFKKWRKRVFDENLPPITWNMYKTDAPEDNVGMRRLSFRSSLTKPTMNLLNMAREHLGKEFVHVWEFAGRVMVRKVPNTRGTEVRSPIHLRQLLEQWA